MTELKLLVDQAMSFSLTAKTKEEQELAERLRAEAREEIDVTLFGIGRLVAILEQFGDQDSRVVRFKAHQKLKNLA